LIIPLPLAWVVYDFLKHPLAGGRPTNHSLEEEEQESWPNIKYILNHARFLQKCNWMSVGYPQNFVLV
jgi:hypothetical protein